MITIRNAVLKDIPKIEKLGKKIKEFVVSKKIRFYEREELVYWIKHPKDNVFLIATEGDKIVGFLFSKTISPHWSILDNVAIDSKVRGQGIGSKLLDKYYSILKERGVRYISGLVGSDYSNTRKFWKNRGFKEGKSFVWIEKFL